MAEEQSTLLTIATTESISSILEYLKADVGNCLYMYIDIKKYGIHHDEMTVWYQKSSEGIILVVMKYYNSISFYSRNTQWSKDAVLSLIQTILPASVSAPLSIMKELDQSLPDYKLSMGWIYEHKHYRVFDVDYIEKAAETDLKEIANLLCIEDGFGSIYQVDSLHKQLVERQREAMGRNLMIKSQEGDIIAHIATYAECDKIAITSGLIVHPDYRKSIYGTALECALVKELLEEQIRAFTFVIEKKRKRFLDALHNHYIGEYGRLTLKKEDKP